MSSKVGEFIIKCGNSSEQQILNELNANSIYIDSEYNELIIIPKNIEFHLKEVDILKKIKHMLPKYISYKKNNIENKLEEGEFIVKNSDKFLKECELILGIYINREGN